MIASVETHAPELDELRGPPPSEGIDAVRRSPPPLHGGPLTLLRFMRRHLMLNPKYALLALRLARRRFLTRAGYRMRLDGMLFLGPRVTLEVGRNGRLRFGRWVWIGYGACILRGVTIGDNAIVGTRPVVTRDVPANAVVAGIPARVIRMRDEPSSMRWE